MACRRRRWSHDKLNLIVSLFDEGDGEIETPLVHALLIFLLLKGQELPSQHWLVILHAYLEACQGSERHSDVIFVSKFDEHLEKLLARHDLIRTHIEEGEVRVKAQTIQFLQINSH